MMVSHDSLAKLTGMFAPPGLTGQWLSDQMNASTAASYDVVVCTKFSPTHRTGGCATWRPWGLADAAAPGVGGGSGQTSAKVRTAVTLSYRSGNLGR